MAYTTIDDPSAHFHVRLYTGTGSSNSVTNNANAGDFKPDWIWIKNRTDDAGHPMFDSSRGVNKNLTVNSTDAESTVTTQVTAFNSDGFTVTTNNGANGSSDNLVAWQWKANGGTVANDTNGDITTSVQASQTAGFSIATYTGNGGSGQTLGHGLGAEADLIIFKDRESSSAWRTYVRLLGASKFLDLNTTNAANTSSNIFPSASSTTIGVEQNNVMNKNNSDFVMYSFRSIQGYSKIGSYTGNGDADGTFVYLGFKPAWIMIKCTSEGSRNWLIYDNKRETFNEQEYFIRAQSSGEEQRDDGYSEIDLLSNGFKLRGTSGDTNKSSATFIYLAFAENPFVSSKGVPTTAR